MVPVHYVRGTGEAGLAPDKIVICVVHTVSDDRNCDYDVEVPVDCVATFDLEACALQHMEKMLGAKLVQEATATPG